MDDENALVEIYRAANSAEAGAVRLALAEAGIEARIENDMIQGAVGEVAAGWTASPRLVVRAADEAAARAVLANWPPPHAGTDDASVCLACGAAMGEAVVCPKCGWTFADSADSTDADAGADEAP